MKWFVYVIKIYMHNLILWWRNHLIAIQRLLIIYASNCFIHQQHSRHQWVHSSILLSLADLSLIYSCRLHGQSICHATQSISLHTGCIPCDQEICLPTTQLINLHTSCRLHGQSICHATRLINLHTSCVLCDEGICVSTGHSIDQSTYQLHAPRWENLPINYTINQSTYQLHTPRTGNLSISHVIGQSTS